MPNRWYYICDACGNLVTVEAQPIPEGVDWACDECGGNALWEFTNEENALHHSRHIRALRSGLFSEDARMSLRYVAHPDDLKRLNRIRRAIGAKPLDGSDPECPRGCIQIIITRPTLDDEEAFAELLRGLGDE